ncbi:MAG: ABC transporter substrate-binding protein [Acidobacteriaceae bacterium]|nr:ABC transporter substrate-binding protein [Acidobacteriaceae bacterium]
MRSARVGVLAAALGFAICAAAADIPRRIVSLSPDLTEMIYGVGALASVVAVSNYDAYPPEVLKLPRLGPLESTNLEKLIALQPDLVVINSSQAPFLEDTLRQLNFRILKASNKTVAEAYQAMLAIGRATGHESEAEKLVSATREGLDRVARKTAGLPKPRVAMIVDRTPGTLRDLYDATGGSYLAELVDIAGGRMAVAAVNIGYAKLSKEDLVAANPDIILDFVHGFTGRFSADPVAAWNEMPELKAVREHRVYSVSEDFVPHASQRMVQTAELFARLIHPERKQ